MSRDDGVTAECVLAALGRDLDEESDATRAYAGALLFVDVLKELRAIRKLLTAE
jgi:hypothetical protein